MMTPHGTPLRSGHNWGRLQVEGSSMVFRIGALCRAAGVKLAESGCHRQLHVWRETRQPGMATGQQQGSVATSLQVASRPSCCRCRM